MKYWMVVLMMLVFAACQSTDDKKVSLQSEQDSLSYSVGLQLGNSIKPAKDDLNMDVLISGLQDALDEEENQITDSDVRANLMKFHGVLSQKRREEQEKLADESQKQGEVNEQKGQAFLEENKAKEDVVVLPSGLQYKVIKAGSGQSPADTDQVTVHYRGRLIDGTEFDSSYKRGEPATFPVNGVIKGWTEALQLMKVGGTWELYIPSDLAYGPQGRPPVIPPSSVLIFEVELLEIN